MPIYEYRCDKCEQIQEKMLKYEERQELDGAPCECGGVLHRIASVPALKFVGKDFYVTESRAEKERKRIAKDYDACKSKVAQDKYNKQGAFKEPSKSE